MHLTMASLKKTRSSEVHRPKVYLNSSISWYKMKSGFKETISAQNKKSKHHAYWQNPQMQYDERSSCFMNCGTHYGVGFNQPIGHHGNPKSKVDVLPQDRLNVKTMSLYPNDTQTEIS